MIRVRVSASYSTSSRCLRLGTIGLFGSRRIHWACLRRDLGLDLNTHIVPVYLTVTVTDHRSVITDHTVNVSDRLFLVRPFNRLPRTPCRWRHGASLSEEPTNEKMKKRSRVDNFTYTGVKNPWTHRNEILHDCRAPWRSYPCKVRWWSVQPFSCGGGSNFRFSHDFGSRPYNRVWSVSGWPQIV